MSANSTNNNLTRLFDSMAAEAATYPVHIVEVTDEADKRNMGLAILDGKLEEPRAAHLLRKTALALGFPSEENQTATQPDNHHHCQVSVEERTQLFTLFAKEAKER